LYVNKFLILQSVRNSIIKKIRMLNIVLFGPPGAGKGTQSEMLISQYHLVHLATGDIFRFNIKNGTDLGKLAKGYMNQGQLVPDEVTIKMLNAEVEKHPKAEGFIFDGFPRTNPQAMALDALLDSKGTAISCMLALEVSEDELKARLLKRAEVSGRADDANIEVIENRIRVYNNETAPVKSYFEQQNKLSLIDGTGTIESITERLLKAIDAKF
jgi:adenylate kinase